jgi:hypothetical protein
MWLPDPHEFMHFHKADDMDGNYIDGTMWLFLKYGIALSAGMFVALRIEPSHRLTTARILSALVALLLLLCFIVVGLRPHSFSTWYRWVTEFLAILRGLLIVLLLSQG